MPNNYIQELHIVFDNPPGHEGPRFIECEDADGKSVNAGHWYKRDDGYWELVVKKLPVVDRRTQEEKDYDMDRYAK